MADNPHSGATHSRFTVICNTDCPENDNWHWQEEPPGDNMIEKSFSAEPDAAGGIQGDSPPYSELIGTSRQRSRDYGLEEHDRPDLSRAARGLMNQALEENRFLYQHAAPVMETLYEQIANTHSMVLLTARSGMILHSLGDADFLEKASQVALQPGVDWSEKGKGTNAIGTALAEEKPIVVHGSQHFLQANRFLTCSCTPIFDPYGKVIGALDVTGDHRSYHQHTMALARMSAQMIENHMFADVFHTEIMVRFHTRAEFLGTLMEGIAVFDPDGRFITANRSAQFQFGMSSGALAAHTFYSLFRISTSQFHDRVRTAKGNVISLCLHNGVTICCRAEHKTPRAFEAVNFSGADIVRPEAQPKGDSKTSNSDLRAQQKASLSSLRYLDTGDTQIAAVIEKLQLVRGRDIPIMILGETGTGKDLLAQAIHNDSPRANHNFVSVNCASIPETLIESELFGYEEGAFTGAKRKGAIGKVQFAHEGTLFLDEIGDMPKHLQARLLRVLQERKVSPLGAGKEVEVDVAVICATNKNLKEMIARGEFREDLYYRLNGLVVRLPALRERQDLEVVARKILASVSQAPVPMGISKEVMSILRQYPWPGNFRQLFNVLRTAVVMAGNSEELLVGHLPEEFLEELNYVGARKTETALPPVEIRVETPAGSVPTPTPPRENHSLESVALEAMAQALRSTRGNVSVAAKLLGVSRNTIYRKKALLPDDIWD
ncbi:acetoin catabolism regulatory protein [Comamonadaceae bacterium OS-1]|nr:acetoin catabolism regulatory protein [Comamonadaceae bacterium OS-1]